MRFSPDQCSSVGWVSSHKRKCCQFDSQSGGHMPGMRTRSPVGCMWEATDQCFSLTSMIVSLSFFLLSPLSKNTKSKIFFKKRRFTWMCPKEDVMFQKILSEWSKEFLYSPLQNWNLFYFLLLKTVLGNELLIVQQHEDSQNHYAEWKSRHTKSVHIILFVCNTRKVTPNL